MSCVNLDNTVDKKFTIVFCQTDSPISNTQADIIKSQTSQMLIGLGHILTQHPELNTLLDPTTGERLISIGRKLTGKNR